MNQTLEDFIQQASLPFKVISLSTNEKVKDALDKLGQAKITSAPLIDHKSKSILGFVDLVDFLQFLVWVASKERASRVTPPSTSLTTDDIGIISARTSEFEMSTLAEVVEIGKRHDQYFEITKKQSLREAIEIFKKGIHRIAITDEEKKIVSIMTQTNLLRYIQGHSDLVGNHLKIELVNSGLLSTSLISVSQTSSAIDAFKMMYEKNVSSVGIEEEGVLTAALSASDLKGIHRSGLLGLTRPVMDYIAEIRKEQKKPSDWLITVPLQSTIEYSLDKMISNRLHRVYVVDVHYKPVGVITMTDIIRECFSNKQLYIKISPHNVLLEFNQSIVSGFFESLFYILDKFESCLNRVHSKKHAHME